MSDRTHPDSGRITNDDVIYDLKDRIVDLEGENRQLRDLSTHLDRSCARLEKALAEWQEKTDWVQKSAKPNELGMHRADVLLQRIEVLQQELKACSKHLPAGGVSYG